MVSCFPLCFLFLLSSFFYCPLSSTTFSRSLYCSTHSHVTTVNNGWWIAHPWDSIYLFSKQYVATERTCWPLAIQTLTVQALVLPSSFSSLFPLDRINVWELFGQQSLQISGSLAPQSSGRKKSASASCSRTPTAERAATAPQLPTVRLAL